MKLIICPICLRWKYLYNGKDAWYTPDVYELAAIETIETSRLLLVLVKGIERYEEECEECITAQCNWKEVAGESSLWIMSEMYGA